MFDNQDKFIEDGDMDVKLSCQKEYIYKWCMEQGPFY